MARIAESRGIKVLPGVAEDLPVGEGQMDFALMVTTICFVEDVDRALLEAYRVLKPGGQIVIGFVDKDSALGREYLEHRQESTFYRAATFYSTAEVVSHLERAGFSDLTFAQTLFHSLGTMTAVDPVLAGYGRGSFVVVRATKPRNRSSS